MARDIERSESSTMTNPIADAPHTRPAGGAPVEPPAPPFAEHMVSAEGPRLRILCSAYAFRPGLGSEPSIGWNIVTQAARRHDVWVITDELNRPEIEAELNVRPVSNLTIIYHDLDGLAKRLGAPFRSGRAHNYRHMYLWHLTAKRVATELHRAIGFDLAHHVTYGSIRNWSPLASLGIPFIWGPVGGGEQSTLGLLKRAPLPVLASELVRNRMNALVRLDPMVRHTAKSASVVLTTTQDSALRLPAEASRRAIVMQNIGLDSFEVPSGERRDHRGFRLVFVGRLVYWKGVDLALEALARLKPQDRDISLTVIGDGPDRVRLESLAAQLGVADRVAFLGALKREETLALLPDHDAFIFPSRHDSGAFAVLEAMAARLPVICLNTGGPGLSTTDECGIRIAVTDQDTVVNDIAAAIRMLSADPDLCRAMGDAGHQRILDHYLWDRVGASMASVYARLAGVPA
jgi:hypothetical protein